MGDNERRQDARYAARFDVRFARTKDAARALNAFSTNFSAGGLCVRATHSYELGEALKIDVTIEGFTYSLDGVVAWVRGEAVGVRFVNVRPEVRERLEGVARTLARTQRELT
ncbi:MAG: PilZ domain-containing protein [Myxococcota bacterium]